MRNNDGSIKGYVLIIVLFVLAVSMVVLVNFISKIYLYANTAQNFKDGEMMSMLIKAGYKISTERGKEFYSRTNFNSYRELPFEEVVDDIRVTAVVVDNNSKFNVNKLVFQNGLVNQVAYEIFKRLLKELELKEDYADMLIDYIDKDKVSRSSTGEIHAKNYFLFSLSELSYIFSKEDLDKLLPYVTFFGDGRININTADYLVLKSLHKDMTEAIAKRLIDARTEKPFENIGAVTKVAGMESIGIAISDVITVKNNSFQLYLKAEKDNFTESVEAGFEILDNKVITKYWKEL